MPGTAACPYSFAKPACSTAEPQTPRDLTAGAVGSMTPKAATLTDAQANFLPLVNVHFHLGAEHKTEAGSCSPRSSAELSLVLVIEGVPSFRRSFQDSMRHNGPHRIVCMFARGLQ